MEGPLASVETVQDISGLSELPEVLKGSSEEDDEGGEACFCKINARANQAILSWLSTRHPSFRPLLITQSLAAKDLSAHSMAPMLGVDTTLPQNRLQTDDMTPRPSSSEYPVWYFFYGTLADTATLRRLFQHIDDKADVEYKLHPARVTRARLTTWADKYKALIDGPPSSNVQGSAFLVRSREHEDTLRSYETCIYEVVRCAIALENDKEEILNGCTFRFAR